MDNFRAENKFDTWLQNFVELRPQNIEIREQLIDVLAKCRIYHKLQKLT